MVSRCSSKMREADGVSWLRYTSTRKQVRLLYGGIWFQIVSPFGCYNSSKLANAWAPPLLNGKKEPAQYRYDGLYDIACMWDAGNRSTKEPSVAPPGSGKGKKRKAPPSMPRTVATRGVRPDSLQALPPPATPAVVPAPPVGPRRLRRRPRPHARTASRRCSRRRQRQRLWVTTPWTATAAGPAPRRPPGPTSSSRPCARATSSRSTPPAASDDGRPMPGLVAETAAAAPEPPRPPNRPRPWTPTRRHRPRRRRRRHPAKDGGRRRRGHTPAAETDASDADGPKTAPDAGTPAAGDDAADAKLALAPHRTGRGRRRRGNGRAVHVPPQEKEDVNACSNAELIERLTKQAAAPAPPPDLMPETLPRLAWVCDAAPDRYDDDDEDFFRGRGL